MVIVLSARFQPQFVLSSKGILILDLQRAKQEKSAKWKFRKNRS